MDTSSPQNSAAPLRSETESRLLKSTIEGRARRRTTGTATWRLAGAGAVIAGFCLPWFTVFGGFFSIPGYRIPDIARLIGQAAAVSGGSADPRLFLLYLLYGIPLLAGVVIVRQLGGGATRSIALAAGAVPLASFAYVFALVGPDLVHMLGEGASLTIAGAVALIASALDAR